MAKGVISNRIYLPKTPELFSKCLTELTYKIPNTRPQLPPEIFNDIALVSSKVFSIPLGCRHLVPEDMEMVDKRVFNPVTFPPTGDIKLREDQQEILDLIEDNCLVNAKPGWGKTFTGMFIAAKLGQKTLIVVHNTSLRDQWELEVKKVFGIKAGVIGSGRFETDAPIVISNTQTLGKHIHKYSKMFGTIICDEVHRVPSSMFKNILDASYARYKIGLSATIKRKDHRHIYIPDYFGQDRFIPDVDTAMRPTVYCLYTDIKLNNKLGHWVTKVTDLCENPKYIDLITDILDIKSNVDNHKVLLLGDRLSFLEEVSSRVANCTLVTSYVGDRMAIHQSMADDKINSIAGTTSIYKEGINIPVLSCLILGCPINNEPLLEQITGRITRPHPGKLTPELWDIVLADPTSKRQFAQRLNFYINQGYKIKEIRHD